MSADVRATRIVDVTQQRAWDVLTDWDRQGEWMPGTSVRSSDAHAVGGRIEARTGLGRLGFLDTMEVVRWEPPRQCIVTHTGRVVRGTGSFLVEPLGPARCRVVWEENLDLPLGPVGRAGWILVRPLARAGLAYALRRFARAVSP